MPVPPALATGTTHLARMRTAGLLASALLLALPGGARAQPERAQPEAAGRSCVDVRVGQENYYDCLNRQLRESVPPAASRRSAADVPYPVDSPPNQLGGFTLQGTRQQLGDNFGRSVVPQRPPQDFGPAPLVRSPR
ncbi:MAG TPA: hypothetical protein VE684_06620 [Crenalkalicoccus sp.]|nr:hypothetical protein [Crenalkalicoccus sp.]